MDAENIRNGYFCRNCADTSTVRLKNDNKSDFNL